MRQMQATPGVKWKKNVLSFPLPPLSSLSSCELPLTLCPARCFTPKPIFCPNILLPPVSSHWLSILLYSTTLTSSCIDFTLVEHKTTTQHSTTQTKLLVLSVLHPSHHYTQVFIGQSFYSLLPSTLLLLSLSVLQLCVCCSVLSSFQTDGMQKSSGTCAVNTRESTVWATARCAGPTSWPSSASWTPLSSPSWPSCWGTDRVTSYRRNWRPSARVRSGKWTTTSIFSTITDILPLKRPKIMCFLL